ncbi:hypothetical protein [Argonema antarcticum]|nr:hypothetical protein [Argonema antarcticum]MCL1475229.1 hypothetical protein [Argonema antarcticum A004/B2]
MSYRDSTVCWDASLNCAIALHAIDQWKYLRAQVRRFYTAVKPNTETNK